MNSENKVDLDTEKKLRYICYDVLAESCMKTLAEESFVLMNEIQNLTQQTIEKMTS